VTAPTAIAVGPYDRFSAEVAGRRAGHAARIDTLPAQLTRFAATGVVTSLVQFGLFFLLYGMGDQTANLASAIVSSALANEIHRRLTFRAGERVTWLAAQWEGGALSVVALASTSLALTLLEDVVGSGWLAGALLILSVNAVVGLIRFALLRVWVFPATAERSPARGLD